MAQNPGLNWVNPNIRVSASQKQEHIKRTREKHFCFSAQRPGAAGKINCPF